MLFVQDKSIQLQSNISFSQKMHIENSKHPFSTIEKSAITRCLFPHWFERWMTYLVIGMLHNWNSTTSSLQIFPFHLNKHDRRMFKISEVNIMQIVGQKKNKKCSLFSDQFYSVLFLMHLLFKICRFDSFHWNLEY